MFYPEVLAVFFSLVLLMQLRDNLRRVDCSTQNNYPCRFY
jgi:hypothetical protein